MRLCPACYPTYLVTDPVVQHTDHGGTFTVGDSVENLINLIRMADWDLDSVAVVQCVQIHRSVGRGKIHVGGKKEG